MQVGANHLRISHHRQQFPRHLPRVQGTQTQPANQPAPGNPPHQLAQGHPGREIVTVPPEMDAGEDDLRETGLGEPAHLLEDPRRRHAAAAPPGGGDDAVAAREVASFLDLEKRAGAAEETPRTQDAHAALVPRIADGYRRTGARPSVPDVTHQLIHAVEACDEIHARKPGHLLRADLRVAAGHRHPGRRTPSPGLAHEPACFPVCPVRDRTGIDDVDVGRFLEGNEGAGLGGQTFPDHRGVILVDLATECLDGYTHGVSPGAGIGR